MPYKLPFTKPKNDARYKLCTLPTKLLQLLANVATQLLVLDLCMSFGFTTIVIAALMDAEDVEGNEELKINSYEASWLGKTTCIIIKWKESLFGKIFTDLREEGKC
jgi:hypothetical protein